MNMKRKSLIMMLIVGTMIVPTMAQERPSGTPFDAIWNEINSIKSTIANLQDQINNIQLIPGPKGDKGDQGPNGVSGYEMVVKEFPIVAREQIGESVNCQSGKKPLGGGVEVVGQLNMLYTMDSFPTINGWSGSVFNTGFQDASFKIYVICANVQ